MILLTWNLNCRVSKIREQLKAISKYKPDVIALQEVTLSSREILKEYFLKSYYKYFLDSLSISREQKKLRGKRKYGQIIASKNKLQMRNPEKFDVPWKERILSADVTLNGKKIELHTTHIPPGSSNGWIKIEMLEGIFKKLNRKTKKLRILCGDFNTPQYELSNGDIVTWGQKVKFDNDSISDRDRVITVRESRGARWDEGERNILDGLKKKNLIDVYRKIHQYGKQDYSWHTPQGRKTGRRFDHIFASVELNPVKCFYDHKVREDGLSDHSAMIAEFKP